MNVGKAEVPTRIPVGQLLVIQAQKMEDGGLKIVNVYFVLDFDQGSSLTSLVLFWKKPLLPLAIRGLTALYRPT